MIVSVSYLAIIFIALGMLLFYRLQLGKKNATLNIRMTFS